MTKREAIKRAESLGYTIRYSIGPRETRLRKAGGAVNSLNLPYEYCRVFKKGKSWRYEECVELLVL